MAKYDHKDSLGTRMKAYEWAFKSNLPIRTPALIRLDGCHFRTYTNWNNCEVWQKRGLCVVKNQVQKDDTIRHIVEPDWNIPIFSEDRNYINRFVYLEDVS